ncbi:hypothetical protein MsAg5_13140 [Methanosarcinaceae archaeon Ag5]|uniref:Uncharacterized protein n=1 Tax=Methanolapillus africanus TaxID=3028297 RepID=A0AAE4MK72_9EURY|nr:hypothetical protein [Methanosarcinaceae archaeon Ag5]
MALFTSSVVLPVWQMAIILVIPFVLFAVTALVLFLFLIIPEARVLFSASYGGGTRFVLFRHSSYSTAALCCAKIDGIKLSVPERFGVIFRPRNKDDVEQVGKFKFVHVHENSPYPQSTTTAYIVDKTVAALRAAGLPDTVKNYDALFRCKLSRALMCGYIEYEEIGDAFVKNDKGEVIQSPVHDAQGNYLYDEPVTEKKKIKKTAQAQIPEEDFEILEKVKADLEKMCVGWDTDGGAIFAFNHLSKIVDTGIAATPGDLFELESEAERKGAMKSGKQSTMFLTIAAGVLVLVIAAIVFLLAIGAI